MSVIHCRICAQAFEKGAPAQPGQDDSSFVCSECGAKGYPQNGWVNPRIHATKFDPKPSLLKRLLGKKS